MKEYLLLFRGGLDFTKAPQEQVLEVILKWKEWVDNLTSKDIYIGGERLTRNEAVVISGNARQITDGPYTANGEMVGGYIGIRADDLQAAIATAKDCPIFNFDGNVEIREIAKN